MNLMREDEIRKKALEYEGPGIPGEGIRDGGAGGDGRPGPGSGDGTDETEPAGE